MRYFEVFVKPEARLPLIFQRMVAGEDARPTGVFMLSGEAKAHEHLRDYS
jgi:hypothetical protein